MCNSSYFHRAATRRQPKADFLCPGVCLEEAFLHVSFRCWFESAAARSARSSVAASPSTHYLFAPLSQVHEYLRSKLCSLYENDCIFDKFECCWNGNDRYDVHKDIFMTVICCM